MTFRATLHGLKERERAIAAIRNAPDLWRVEISEPKHSVDQRGKLNAMCGEIARQATYQGMKLSKDDWRHLIAAMTFKLRLLPNLDGDGIVTLTPSTSQMSREDMGKMIEAAYYVGARFGVTFSEDRAAA